MPEICQEGLLWLLQATNPSALYHCLTADTLLRRAVQVHGFKLSEQSVGNEKYSRMLAAQLMHDPEVLTQLIQAVLHCRWWQNRARHCLMLDKEWLLENWRALLATVADPRPWAMFLAERYTADEKGHRLGSLLRQCPSLWQIPAVKDTDAPLSGVLAYFQIQPENNAAAAELQHVQGEFERFRHHAAHKYSQAQEEHKQRGQELAAALRELDELSKTLREVRRSSAEQLRAATEQEQTARQAELHALLQCELGLLPALPALLNDAQEARYNLATRVETTLEKQAERNVRYGLKSHIRQEISNLEKLQKKLQDAVDDSVALAPELLPLLAEVEGTLNGLYRRLDENSTASVIPDRLRAALYSIRLDAEALPLLAEFEQCLNSRMAQTLLLPDETAELRQRLAERQRLWSVAKQTKQPDVALPAKVLWRLDGYADSFTQTEIYVDFYNVLLQDSVLSMLGRNPNGLAEARHILIERCRKLSRRFRRIVLVLDSPEALSQHEETGRLTIIYAAAIAEAQNADNKLVDILQSPAAGPRWLVTDDLALRARAERYCSAVVHTAALRALLLQDNA